MVDVAEDFREDLRRQIVAMLTAGLYDVDPSATAHDVFVGYFNLKLRLITPSRRVVKRSRELEQRVLSQEIRDGIDRIEADAEAGVDLEKYLSTGVARAPADYDLLLNDWGIHHLHLGPPVPGRRFVGRTNQLLFVYVSSAALYFIDVLNHGDWARQRLLNIMHSNWPDVMGQFQMKGLLATERPNPTDEEYAQLRNAGVTVLLNGPNGGVFVGPGLGIATTGLNVRVLMRADELDHQVRMLQEGVRAHAGEISAAIAAETGQPAPGLLNLTLIAEEDNHGGFFFTLRESSSGIAFTPDFG